MLAQPAATTLVPALEDDDSAFCELAERTLRGVAARFEPQEIIVVHIDRWFGRAWLGFKCKHLGAFGVTSVREGPHVVLPPFVPARVRSQRRFDWAGGELRERDAGRPLHIRQPSHENERRRLGRLLHRRTILAWISGGSAERGRAALMVYAWDPPDQLAFWYAGAARVSDVDAKEPEWGWVQTLRVSRAELAAWSADRERRGAGAAPAPGQ